MSDRNPPRSWREPAVPMRDLLLAGALLVASTAASEAASSFVARRFPDRPMPADLLLDALPYLEGAPYVADGAVILAYALLAIYVGRCAVDRLPRTVAVIASMYLIRACLIVLTPLASPHGAASWGLLPPQNGMFPSGHAAAVLLCFLLVERDRAPRLRAVMLALAAVEWGALLLGRGHYSIDVAGGLLLAYFVWREWTDGVLFAPLRRLLEGDLRAS